MINELTILNKLKEVLVKNINNYTASCVEQLEEKNFKIDFPNVDLMQKNTMIYIQPNYASYNELSVCSDQSDFNIALFIICKRDNTDNLITKTFEVYNSIYELFRSNQSLDGTVDFVDIQSFDYYPQIEANKNVVGIEMNVGVRYSKDW